MFDEYLDVWILLKLIEGYNNLYKKNYIIYVLLLVIICLKLFFLFFCIVKFYKKF